MTIFSMRIALGLSLLFLNSCVSSIKKRELLKLENDDPVNQVVKLIQDRCFQEKRPQFLVDFSTESMKNIRTSPFEIEGVWEHSYNLLKTSVIGPLGEEYLSFDIDGYNLNYNNQSNLLMNDNFEKISSLLSRIGAKGLRTFLCGQFAFQFLEENNGIFTVKDKLNEDFVSKIKEKTEILKNNRIFHKEYFSISTIQIAGHSIEVQSNIALTKKGNGYGVVVNSRFYYGPFSQDAQVEVKWVGFVNSDSVLPTSTVFRTKEEVYRVNFSEYQ